MTRILLLASLLVLAVGCASSGGSAEAAAEADAPEPQAFSADTEGGRISPLGLGQPDPERMFERALAAHEAGQFWAFMSYFAFIDQKGQYFIAREESDDEERVLPDQRATRALAHSLRNFISSDWVTVEYGRPRNIRDVPTTSAVPMRISYDFSRLTPERKQRVLDEFNVMLEMQGVKKQLTWEEYKSQLLNGPRTAERRFVRIDGAWRFDAGWRIE